MTKPAKWFECIHGHDHEPCPECDKEPEWSKEHDSPAEYELAQKLKAANERIAELEDKNLHLRNFINTWIANEDERLLLPGDDG